MLALPELENDPKIIAAWRKIGLNIVKDWTKEKPENHQPSIVCH